MQDLHGRASFHSDGNPFDLDGDLLNGTVLGDEHEEHEIVRVRRTSTPLPSRASRIGFGHVKTLTIRNKLISKLYQHKRRARSPLRPTGYSVYASPIACSQLPQ
jgi:hypothetical protein